MKLDELWLSVRELVQENQILARENSKLREEIKAYKNTVDALEKTCPPCHGDCNQGRNCPATKPIKIKWKSNVD